MDRSQIAECVTAENGAWLCALASSPLALYYAGMLVLALRVLVRSPAPPQPAPKCAEAAVAPAAAAEDIRGSHAYCRHCQRQQCAFTL